MTQSVAAAILAGGQSKRMGRDKAMLRVGNRFLVDRIFSELRQEFSQIRVIGPVRAGSKIESTLFVSDMIEGLGPMSGLYTALNQFVDPVLVVPCDMPKITVSHIRRLLSVFQAAYRQAIVARGRKGIEPLFAIYTQECLEVLNLAIEKGEYALYKFIERLNVSYVDFSAEDKNSDLFFNINTLSDYKKALYLKTHLQK